MTLKVPSLSVTLLLAFLSSSCGDDRPSVPSANGVLFVCPVAGCEAATDPTAMMILIMHQTDTPGDNGIFDSATRTRGYVDAVASGKILRLVNGGHGSRVYRTEADPSTPARYSVVKVLDGRYSGRAVLIQDEYLTATR
jgi:hypothetical protein